MHYGYILQSNVNKQKFPVFSRPKIKMQEKYKTADNILNFFYLSYKNRNSHDQKTAKKLMALLKQHKTEYIAFEPALSHYASFFQENGFNVFDGSSIKKHLLVQRLFAYIKAKQIDIEKTGIHLCADNINDIDFFFEKISKLNTVFSMDRYNEKFYDSILKKYGIAVHFSDTVCNKIIIGHNGKIPYSTNSHLIDLYSGNYKIICTKFPCLFPDFTPTEAELLLRMNYPSCDEGFYDSGIKTVCF